MPTIATNILLNTVVGDAVLVDADTLAAYADADDAAAVAAAAGIAQYAAAVVAALERRNQTVAAIVT